MHFLNLIFSIPHLKILLAAVLLIVILELVLHKYKNSVKGEYKRKKQEILSSEEAERASLHYFSKLHIVGLVRVSYFVILMMVLIALYDIRAFSFFAVAFGAIVIALRDVIVSLFAYPYVVLTYDIGDDVRIVGALGEIVRVGPLATSLAGKDEKGDYNGKLHSVPNSRFFLDSVERQEIKNRSHRKVELHALYNHEEHTLPFSEWLRLLKEKLDDMLAKRSLKEVGNFKSHAGMKYKLHYDYDKDGYVTVSISFISSIKTASDKKEQIITFIESMKEVNTPLETKAL